MGKKKIISLLAVVFFLLALTLSLDFMAVRAEHECIGDDCQICAVLRLADEISGGKKAETSHAFAIFRSSAECNLISEKYNAVAAESPVSRCDILTI